MAVLRDHLLWYHDLFQLPGFLREPVLLFGFQEVWLDELFVEAVRGSELLEQLRSRHQAMARCVRTGLPDVSFVPPSAEALAAFCVADLVQYLKNRGIRDVTVLDRFDPQADLRH